MKIYYSIVKQWRKSLDQIQREHCYGLQETDFISITSLASYFVFLPFGQAKGQDDGQKPWEVPAVPWIIGRR